MSAAVRSPANSLAPDTATSHRRRSPLRRRASASSSACSGECMRQFSLSLSFGARQGWPFSFLPAQPVHNSGRRSDRGVGLWPPGRAGEPPRLAGAERTLRPTRGHPVGRCCFRAIGTPGWPRGSLLRYANLARDARPRPSTPPPVNINIKENKENVHEP